MLELEIPLKASNQVNFPDKMMKLSWKQRKMKNIKTAENKSEVKYFSSSA